VADCELCQNKPRAVTVVVEVTTFFQHKESEKTATSHEVCEQCAHAWRARAHGSYDDAGCDARRERRVRE
jgi:hypothetical protein